MTVDDDPGRQGRIRVIGSGPVALAFVGFARRQGIAARQIELECDSGPLPDELGSRCLALSHGSWQLLSRIARLPKPAPISTVDVTLSGIAGNLRITAREMQVEALGYVTRYRDLWSALQQGLEGLHLRAPGSAVVHPWKDPSVIVHAQGDCGPDASELRFEQEALLAEIRIESAAARTAPGTAFECFTPNGPLALLPAPEPGRYTLIWCDRPERTRARADLDAAQFSDQLQRAFGWRLGLVQLADEPRSTPSIVPMLRRSRRQIVRDNQVWIGNAAQALHPVAGQGLNLGLRDAFELAQSLGQSGALEHGAVQALQRYARGRRGDRRTAIMLTDTLARAFAIPAFRPLQALALSSLDLMPTVRRALAQKLMFGMR
ncbi:MAG: FAD-dependent monooxygenase [Quisquiliibacterium sp.]